MQSQFCMWRFQDASSPTASSLHLSFCPLLCCKVCRQESWHYCLAVWAWQRSSNHSMSHSQYSQRPSRLVTTQQDFFPCLKDHLLACLWGLTYDGNEHDFSDADHDNVLITEHKIFEHKTLRVNYTTYDLWHEQDTINPLTHLDIMVLSHEDDCTHPYWYARVIWIFHVNVKYRNHPNSLYSKSTHMNVLFVCWFWHDGSFTSGFHAKRLPRCASKWGKWLKTNQQPTPNDNSGEWWSSFAVLVSNFQ